MIDLRGLWKVSFETPDGKSGFKIYLKESNCVYGAVNIILDDGEISNDNTGCYIRSHNYEHECSEYYNEVFFHFRHSDYYMRNNTCIEAVISDNGLEKGMMNVSYGTIGVEFSKISLWKPDYSGTEDDSTSPRAL